MCSALQLVQLPVHTTASLSALMHGCPKYCTHSQSIESTIIGQYNSAVATAPSIKLLHKLRLWWRFANTATNNSYAACAKHTCRLPVARKDSVTAGAVKTAHLGGTACIFASTMLIVLRLNKLDMKKHKQTNPCASSGHWHVEDIMQKKRACKHILAAHLRLRSTTSVKLSYN
eukprot:GHRR01026682.1.p1 GENE.GHRR01026682.1~~GHRR01026682.1.p1  ORF type:complete len:173 (-),score=32.62 GHRR01026682.1:1226-1744(-)